MILEYMVALSGGIDSTSVLYHLLKEKKKVLVLHIKLINREGRQKNETKAVQNILKWFDKYDMKTYEYLEMGFDYGNVDRLTRDNHVVGFMSGIVLSDVKYDSIHTFVHGTSKTDADYHDANHQRIRKLMTEEMMRAPGGLNIPYNPERQIIFAAPNLQKTKTQVMRELPKNLLQLCWYCRFPTPQNKVCGNCHTCRWVKRATREGIYVHSMSETTG
jgi:7-cyano-7-deazaguanine synthase in queuosine biosynthesis